MMLVFKTMAAGLLLFALAMVITVFIGAVVLLVEKGSRRKWR